MCEHALASLCPEYLACAPCLVRIKRLMRIDESVNDNHLDRKYMPSHFLTITSFCFSEICDLFNMGVPALGNPPELAVCAS